MSNRDRTQRDPALQGEGNRTADRDYREAATRSANDPANKRGAREAERAIDSAEDAELEEAETEGKARRKDV